MADDISVCDKSVLHTVKSIYRNLIKLYGAEVWAESLNPNIYRKKLGHGQIRSALSVASAYRTIFELAVLVVVGVKTILISKECRTFYRRRRGMSPRVTKPKDSELALSLIHI